MEIVKSEGIDELNVFFIVIIMKINDLMKNEIVLLLFY